MRNELENAFDEHGVQMQDMLLMMKDERIMSINFDTGKYQVLNQQLLPWQMKGRFRESLPEKDSYSRYEMTQALIVSRSNQDAVVSWLATRVLPLSRTNAKKVYNLFGCSQLQDDISKAKIALMCRAVSLQDNYWVKLASSDVGWKDVNLRSNKLSDVVAQVSLHGSSLSLQGSLATPELTGSGAYAKAWFRKEDGDLYLYKRGAVGSYESRIEVMVSDLLDHCNVSHLKYSAEESNGVYCCSCKCMTTEDISILPAMDFDGYCSRHDLDFYKEIMKIDAEMIYKMWIVDYLISNGDRHGMNWGFFYNCNTNEILGCHPLFDHNNAFDIPLMQDPQAPYLFHKRMTMKQAAQMAMKCVDFHFDREFTKEDFITERQYESFTARAHELGIIVKI